MAIRRIKKRKMSRAGAKLANDAWMGPEPEFAEDHVLSHREEGECYTWYNYMLDEENAREFLIEFLEDQERQTDAIKLKSVAKCWIPKTAAWLVRIQQRGGLFERSRDDFIETHINKCLSRVVETTPAEEEFIPKAIYKKTQRANTIIGDIETAIDSRDPEFSIIENFKEIEPALAKRLISYYKPLVNEVELAIQGEDPQIAEAYRSYEKQELVIYKKYVQKIINDASKFITEAKKDIPPKEKVKFIKALQSDSEFKLVCLDPVLIIGASEVWLTNIKYKTLTVLKAKTEAGLDVHRTAVIDYDEATSMTKRAGRHYAEVVKKVKKPSRHKIMDKLKTAALDLKNMINGDTMILNVIRDK